MRVAVSSCMVILQLAGPGLALGEGGLASVAFPLLRVRTCASPRGQPGAPPTRFHVQRTQGGIRYHPRGSGGAAEQLVGPNSGLARLKRAPASATAALPAHAEHPSST